LLRSKSEPQADNELFVGHATASLILGSIVGALFPISAAAKDCANPCTGDEAITSEVDASFQRYAELAIPNAIRVQTRNQVVYLYGHVSTGMQRDDAVSLAQGYRM
jgi:hypothetical protein